MGVSVEDGGLGEEFDAVPDVGCLGPEELSVAGIGVALSVVGIGVELGVVGIGVELGVVGIGVELNWIGVVEVSGRGGIDWVVGMGSESRDHSPFSDRTDFTFFSGCCIPSSSIVIRAPPPD